MAGVLLAGLMNPLVNGPFVAIIQYAVPPELQGRVFAVIGSVAGAASPLGMAIAGPSLIDGASRCGLSSVGSSAY